MKNADLLKQAFEKGLAHTRELTLAKANTEAFDVLAKRMAEGLNEIWNEAKRRAVK